VITIGEDGDSGATVIANVTMIRGVAPPSRVGPMREPSRLNEASCLASRNPLTFCLIDAERGNVHQDTISTRHARQRLSD
jgi:hypothetical protein